MPIVQVDHVTKEYKLGQLTSLKHTPLDDIAIGVDSTAKTENWRPTPLTLRKMDNLLQKVVFWSKVGFL